MRNFSGIIALVFLSTIFAGCEAKRAAEIYDETYVNNELAREASGSGLLVRYIANEGVLISSGEKQVLIDGLHREYKAAYAFPPPALLKRLEEAQAPFDKIDLLLVSHIHLDHFHPQSVALHLKNNPRATLVSSEQVIAEVSKNFADYGAISPRAKSVRHEWKSAVEMEHGGIKLKILSLRHANRQHLSVQNLGHLVEIDGVKLLHVGDADMTAENFASFGLARENIDVAFIPYWFLLSEEGRALVREQFNPKQIIAVHISPDEAEETAARLAKDAPGAVAFTKILEEKSF